MPDSTPVKNGLVPAGAPMKKLKNADLALWGLQGSETVWVSKNSTTSPAMNWMLLISLYIILE